MTGTPLPKLVSVRTLSEHDIGIAFQPIVDVLTGKTLAHEALTRCKHPQFTSPAALFEQASAEQSCGRLGRTVRNVLFEKCGNSAIFINLHPQEMSQRWLVQPTDPLFLHDGPLYLEITETAAFQQFDLCISVLNELRARSDAKVVVDDFGVGFSDYRRVEQLQPDLVKLDMSLVRELHNHPEKQQQVRQIIRRCKAVGAQIVAEGIETQQELVACMDCGADYGQGYLLGRPAPELKAGYWPEELSAPNARRRKRDGVATKPLGRLGTNLEKA